MKSIGIFYGSSTGTTATVADQIAKALGIDASHVYDVSDVDVAKVADYDVLLLGSSTWGFGDLQDDWEGFLPALKKQNLNGKKVGLFGCGDAEGYSDTFCSALGNIKKELESTGCTFVGAVKPEGYNYDDSDAEVDGMLVGLCIDDANQSDLSDERIAVWIDALGL